MAQLSCMTLKTLGAIIISAVGSVALVVQLALISTARFSSIFLWLIIFCSVFYLVMYFRYSFSENGRIVHCVAKNLKSCGLYLEFNDFIVIPKITSKNHLVTISIPSLKIRKNIEKYIDFLSASLPSGLLCNECYFSEDNKFLYLKLEDVSSTRRLFYEDPVADITQLKKEPLNEVVLDKDTVLNFDSQIHLLIVGGTGSGKSYCASYITSVLFSKGWDIYIFDIKRSYAVFKPFCNCSFSKEEILENFKNISNLVLSRQIQLEKKIESTGDFNLILNEPVLILIEELSALLSVLEKKEKDQFLSVLSNLIMIGRQINMHLIIVMQVSSADTLPSSIRANCIPIALGNLPETIQKTAFGVSTKIVHRNFEKGEGLLGLDGVHQKHVFVPTLSYSIQEFLTVADGTRRGTNARR